MPMPPPKVSVVIPIHNAQHRIAAEIQRVLDALIDLSRQRSELIIVDDGSNDSTPEVLDELMKRFPQVRVLRHPAARDRGGWANGFAGSRWRTGVYPRGQPADSSGRYAATVPHVRRPERRRGPRQSTPRPLSGALRRRLEGFRGAAAEPLQTEPTGADTCGLQMIRRPHLQHLRGPMAPGVALRGEVFDLTSIS